MSFFLLSPSRSGGSLLSALDQQRVNSFVLCALLVAGASLIRFKLVALARVSI